MKLGAICPAPCFAHAAAFEVPPPGCKAAQLRFGGDGGREFHAALLTNHDLTLPKPNPKVAIVGLSPAATQIDKFVAVYGRTGSYAKASMAGAFASLSREIIAMFDGLGLTKRVGLTFPNPESFSNHPDIHVTSLVACVTLTKAGGSEDFDPATSAAAQRCITERFLPEMLSPDFSRLSHVVILGAKGWKALSSMKTGSGTSVVAALRRSGKTVLNLPHPSGANRELVNLASFPPDKVPARTTYAQSMWEEYRHKPPKPGRGKQTESAYKAKRLSIWDSVDRLRHDIERSFAK